MSFISVDGWEPPHLSYSTVAGYRDCGKKIQLGKVLRLEERPGIAALAGNAVHTATEWVDLLNEDAELGIVDWSWDEADPGELFTAAWDEAVKERLKRSPSFTPDQYVATGRASKDYGGRRGEKWWFDHGPGMVQAWIDWRRESISEGWGAAYAGGQPGIELELNFRLGDIPVKAFIDRLFVTPSGQLAVVDLKTGRIPETPEQLGTYAVALKLVHGLNIEYGFWWHPDKGLSDPKDLSLYTPDYLERLFTDAAAGMNAGVFLPKPANNCRAWCGVARFCAAAGGTEAAGHDPLLLGHDVAFSTRDRKSSEIQ